MKRREFISDARRRGGVADGGARGAGVKAANYRPLGFVNAVRLGSLDHRIPAAVARARLD